jgi:phenylalanyl-tRNA synthetase alpha chain
MRKINSFFRYYGYSVYEGPEIETNEFNFEKLNLPKDHPARELADTLYIQEPEILLRTHTSSVEARALTKEELPLRIVVPGKVYRNETENTTNNSMFYQYEGLVVDKNMSMADLKGTLNAFVRFLYGDDVKTRFRCKYYPQVEPGAGLDVQCTFCHGKGCQVCKYRGYIEVLGAGMVHPNMLKNCNVDTKIWNGFAFGMGFDRLVMLSYGINDVRKLYNGELVFDE